MTGPVTAGKVPVIGAVVVVDTGDVLIASTWNELETTCNTTGMSDIHCVSLKHAYVTDYDDADNNDDTTHAILCRTWQALNAAFMY